MAYYCIEFLFKLLMRYTKDYGVILLISVILLKIVGELIFKGIRWFWKQLKQINFGMNESKEQDVEKYLVENKVEDTMWMHALGWTSGIIILICIYIKIIYSLFEVVKNYMFLFENTILTPWVINIQQPDPYYIIPVVAFVIRTVSNLFLKYFLNEGKLRKKDIILTIIISMIELIIMTVIPAGIALFLLFQQCINATIKIKMHNVYKSREKIIA